MDNAVEYILTGTKKRVTYTVKSGDSPWTIASKYDVTVREILNMNEEKDFSALYPGCLLYTSSSTAQSDLLGVRHKIVFYFNKYKSELYDSVQISAAQVAVQVVCTDVDDFLSRLPWHPSDMGSQNAVGTVSYTHLAYCWSCFSH